MLSFPPHIAFGAVGGPRYHTEIIPLKEGTEKRYIKHGYPLITYQVSHSMLSYEDIRPLLKLFHICHGKYGVFRFRDWADYWVKKQLVGVGDGKVGRFLLYVSYGEVRRFVSLVCKETFVLYFNNQIVSPDRYVLDDRHGVVEMKEVPADGIVVTADFEFDIPMRFNQDHLPITIDSEQRYSLHNLELIEVVLD